MLPTPFTWDACRFALVLGDQIVNSVADVRGNSVVLCWLLRSCLLWCKVLNHMPDKNPLDLLKEVILLRRKWFTWWSKAVFWKLAFNVSRLILGYCKLIFLLEAFLSIWIYVHVSLDGRIFTFFVALSFTYETYDASCKKYRRHNGKVILQAKRTSTTLQICHHNWASCKANPFPSHKIESMGCC